VGEGSTDSVGKAVGDVEVGEGFSKTEPEVLLEFRKSM
jgi:hypothetical protein